MPNVDDIKDFVNTPKKPKAAVKLMGGNEDDQVVLDTAVTNEDIVIDETAATNEESENSVEIDDIANAYADNIPKKREKILKGIYLDSDVLEKYKLLSDKMPRGWGSQLVSDLLRKEFIRQGIKLDPK